MSNKQKTAIFPGSFDPFTNGHKDIVLRSLKIFDVVIIAIGHNTSKHKRYFDIDLMVRKIEESFIEYGDRVKVVVYNELTAFLADKLEAKFLIRGLRNTTDFEYENSISQVNADINKELETVFLITSHEFAAISSTIIREIHRYGADVSKYLPYEI
ncbi:pantetheine-phosphate adenylyltransferase [Mangrovivirga cuniculi]|uniref:Phosphopantetheine adenylyltransferase n=1 Tax=Mangrovivirga cuniculi TaxID=2715131 RepID=A0A4D7JMJ7_9BACT|nr:pantetheine-phosphate adenylyltransferase [Mangrovivirga cuniculi]QCK16083.1 pantetheine-phosphate adenylyltransferase [Mangrovivirga cuniculi]